MPFRKVTEIWRGWEQYWEVKVLGFTEDRASTLVAAPQRWITSGAAGTLPRMRGHKDLAVSGNESDTLLGEDGRVLHLMVLNR